MRPCAALASLLIPLSTVVSAAPRAQKPLQNVAPAPARPAPGSFEADLAAVRDTKQQFFHETLIGWTADHRIVFRAAVCDDDEGGGRGPYCDILLCTAKPEDIESVRADCAPLVGLNLAENDDRTKLDLAAARKAESEALAPLGALTSGSAIPTTSFLPSTRAKQLSLTRSGKAGTGTIPVFSYGDVSMSERAQSVDTVKVTAASTDGTCVAAVGHFRFHSDYEGVPTRTPMFFGAVRCK